MSNLGFNIGIQALQASRAALETIGHNVSNANTPGYSRQSLHLSASPELLIEGRWKGSGVEAGVTTRSFDPQIMRRLAIQAGVVGALDARKSGLAQIESMFSESGDNGLGTRMKDMYAALSQLAASPNDRVLRDGAVKSAGDMTARFHTLSRDVSNFASDNAQQITFAVGQVNDLTERIAGLNIEIGRFESSGEPANDLRDERDRAVNDLGQLVNINPHEDSNGHVSVSLGGHQIVGVSESRRIVATASPNGQVRLRLTSGTSDLTVQGGKIGGLMRIAGNSVPDIDSKLDQLAKQLIFESNRAHSTGIPAEGSFKNMTAQNAFRDVNGDGSIVDEPINEAGLPFDIQDGALWVTMSNVATGELSTTKIPIDTQRTTVGDLVDAITNIPHLSGVLDAFGRLEMTADNGYRFDFGGRQNMNPNAQGTLGSSTASLATGSEGPFGLTDGDTLQITGATSTFTVAFAAADFEDITRATPEELAAVLNSNADVTANGMRAVVVGDSIALQTAASGPTATFTVDGGSALPALGLTAGQVVTGDAHSVEATVSGSYTGTANDLFTFRAEANGEIGTTPGLTIDVFNSIGQRVKTLSVGAEYVPGTELEFAPGLKIKFSVGDVSSTDHDMFVVDALKDSDTSDVLAAMGMNAFFTGTDAQTIEVRADIAENPQLLSAGHSGSAGDNSSLLSMIDAKNTSNANLDDLSFGAYWATAVSNVGFEIGSATSAQETEEFLLSTIQSRRDEISGVNVDEELVNMVQFEQAFQAAAQYIQTLQTINGDIMQLI